MHNFYRNKNDVLYKPNFKSYNTYAVLCLYI